ncbi:MAG: hypothetical protein HYY93_11280 [Planctomycetes bacterium]|nr:hypothetical protein [Planctomycetota bacterium]
MNVAPLEDAFRRAVDVLQRLNIPFFVYGGLAVPTWGQVVNTRDADFVVQVDERSATALIDGLRNEGFDLPPRAAFLFLVDTWAAASLGGRKVDFALGATPFDESARARTATVRIFDREVPVASAEDLILYKLCAFRRKDLAHIEDIIKRQGRRLDLSYLRRWADEISRATGKFEVPSTLEKMLAEEGLA